MKVDWHKWVNTIIALAALVVAVWGGYFQYQDQLGKEEKLKISLSPNLNARIVEIGNHAPAVLSLPFQVTVSNVSESTTSIVSYDAYSVHLGGKILFSGNAVFPEAYNELDERPRNAVGLMGGDSIFLTALIAFPIKEEISSMILEEHKGQTVSVSEIERTLCKHGIDLFGNKVEARGLDLTCEVREFVDIRYNPVAVVELMSGRGNKFIGEGNWFPFDLKEENVGN